MTLNRQGLPTSCPHPPGRPTSSLNGMSRISLAHNLTLTYPRSPVLTCSLIASRCTRHPQPTSTHQNHNTSKPCTHACMAHAVPVEVGLFLGLRIDESTFFFFFFSSPVLLRISTHTLSPPSHAPTPAWPEVEAATPSQGIDNNHTCTRIVCITHLCPPHGFYACPVVGMQPTTLFAPQIDHCH